LEKKFANAQESVDRLTDRVMQLKSENTSLSQTVKDYKIVRNVIGDDKVNHILEQSKLSEHAEKQAKNRLFPRKRFITSDNFIKILSNFTFLIINFIA